MSNEKDIVKVTENWLKESGAANKILEDINAESSLKNKRN